ALRRPDPGASQLCHRPRADEPAVLAGRGRHGADLDLDCVPAGQQRALGLVCRDACPDGVSDFRNDAVPHAAPISVTMKPAWATLSRALVLRPIEPIPDGCGRRFLLKTERMIQCMRASGRPWPGRSRPWREA